MPSLIYQCPHCRLHCFHRLTDAREAEALARHLPILRACWSCGIESLVLPKDAALSPNGCWDTLKAHAFRIADACSRRAATTTDEKTRIEFRMSESSWRIVGARAGIDEVVALVGASIAGLPRDAGTRRSA
jgi:hypothetical protein